MVYIRFEIYLKNKEVIQYLDEFDSNCSLKLTELGGKCIFSYAIPYDLFRPTIPYRVWVYFFDSKESLGDLMELIELNKVFEPNQNHFNVEISSNFVSN